MDRDRNLKFISERIKPFDVVIIGGGATGASCALDAASRGFSVLLLEQHDFGKGTSSRSTKLIHGGVRYLRQGNISLVRESIRERGLLLKNAPHVVHLQEFAIPCYSLWEKIFYGFGMKVYDLLAWGYSIGSSQIIDRGQVVERLPGIKREGLKGGVRFFDGQFDDTRLLIDVLRTAEQNGALALNYSRVGSLTRNIEGKIDGVIFVDEETGRSITVGARSVVNAAGTFCSAIQKMSDRNVKPVVTFSRGTHLVFGREFLPGNTAVLIPKTSDGRVLFYIPWHDHVLAGTTDVPIGAPELEPWASNAEIEFILENAGKYFVRKPVRDDILSVFSGIRPLIRKGVEANTSSLSRGHELFVDASGLITITGGKWTTARKMAEDAVDKAVKVGGLKIRACETADLLIKPPAPCLDDELLDTELDITNGDVLRAVRDEMARNIEDVLARRTRALFLNADAAMALAPVVAGIMARELGFDRKWIERQIGDFRALALAYAARPDEAVDSNNS